MTDRRYAFALGATTMAGTFAFVTGTTAIANDLAGIWAGLTIAGLCVTGLSIVGLFALSTIDGDATPDDRDPW